MQSSRATEKPSFPAMRHMTPELVGNDGSGPRCLGGGKSSAGNCLEVSSYYSDGLKIGMTLGQPP